MFIRSIRRASRTPALLALLLLLAAAPTVRADEVGDPDTTADGWKKVFAYARCAIEVFKAITPTDWTVAILDCSRTFLDESATGAKP